MPSKLNINTTFIAAIVLSFLIFFTIVGVYKQQDDQKAESAALIAGTQDLLLKTERFSSLASQVETDSRAFTLTGQPSFLQGYKHSKNEVLFLGDTLRNLLADNPTQKAAIDSLLIYTRNRIAFADSLLAVQPPVEREVALLLVSSGKGLTYLFNTKRLVDAIRAQERILLEDRKSLNRHNNLVVKYLVLSIAFVILVLLVVLIWKEKKYYEFTRDVTAKRKVLQEIETLHKQINQASDAICTLDANLNITSWNFGAERMYGYSSGEVMGKNWQQSLKPALATTELRDLLAELHQNDHWSGEFVRLTKKGKTV